MSALVAFLRQLVLDTATGGLLPEFREHYFRALYTGGSQRHAIVAGPVPDRPGSVACMFVDGCGTRIVCTWRAA